MERSSLACDAHSVGRRSALTRLTNGPSQDCLMDLSCSMQVGECGHRYQLKENSHGQPKDVNLWIVA